MLAPFTAGWQTTDNPLIIEKSEVNFLAMFFIFVNHCNVIYIGK